MEKRSAKHESTDGLADCFTALIGGKRNSYFFERIDSRFTGRLGRSFAGKMQGHFLEKSKTRLMCGKIIVTGYHQCPKCRRHWVIEMERNKVTVTRTGFYFEELG